MATQPNDLLQKIDSAKLENYKAQKESLALNIREIKRKIESGQGITSGELDLVKQYKRAEIAIKAYNGQGISDKELDFLKSYKETSIVGNEPKEITQTGGARESKLLTKLKNNPEAIKGVMNNMSEVLDLPIGDKETLRERLLTKVYGRIYVSGAGDQFLIEKNGELVPAPKEDLLTLDSGSAFGGKLVAGELGLAAGAGLGAVGGPLGSLAGGAIGAGLGEGAIGLTQRAGHALYARELGLIEDKEVPQFALNVLGDAAKESAVVTGFTGALKAIAPLASKIAKKIRIAGNTGNQIEAAKGEVEYQSIIDKIFEETKPVRNIEEASPDINVFGQTSKNIALKKKNDILQQSENLFNQADASFADKVQSGTFKTVNVSDIYNKFTNDLSKFTREGLIDPDEAANVLTKIQRQLNGLRGDIAAGAQQTTQEGLSKLFGGSADNAFDATKVTANDFRRTVNVIGSLFDNVKSPQTQKVLAQLRGSLNLGLGEGAENILKDIGKDPTIVSQGKKLVNELSNIEDFAKYRQAFKVKKQLYKNVPEIVKEVTEETDPSVFAQQIKKLKPQEAKQFRLIVDSVADPSTKQTYNKSLLNELTKEKQIRRKGQRLVRKNLSQESIDQAKAKSFGEVEALEQTGTKAKMKPVKEAFLKQEELSSQVEPTLTGKGLDDVLRDSPTYRVLFGEESGKVTELANRLRSAQNKAGRVTTLPESKLLNEESVIPVGQAVLDSALSAAPGGKFVSKVLSGAVNPTQRGLASLIEATPKTSVAPFGGVLSRGFGISPTDEPTEEQRKRYQLGATKTRLLD